MSQYTTQSQTSGGAPIEIINGNAGTATPVAGAVNIVGGSNINTVGGGSTLTVNVSGTTNNSLQLGNVGGSLTSLGAATNGQIPIGNTGNPPTLATITPGSGITISSGAGTISVSSSAGGMAKSDITTSQTLIKNTIYFVSSGALSLALPTTASSTLGDVVEVLLNGGTSWTITEDTGGRVRLGTTLSTVTTGTVASMNQGDWIELRYHTGGLWVACAKEGNFTIV